MSVLGNIEQFLGVRRLAMIGVSRSPRDFSRMLYAELCKRGYDVVPVNPNAQEIDGRKCFAAVDQIEPPVEAALLMTPANQTDAALRDCATAGVKRVWLYRATGKGAVSPGALQFCKEQNMEAVPGFCPFMFLPHSGFPHGLHRFITKLTGSYPK